ncbi:MAG: serine/threonine protein kinase [Candidatus Bathyarchaeota archaeon]|nr:MAG: serine/threonine protein kinase [Candidatus Bathyarchaeum tardum]WNZ28608.1 MAG: serine/threonine protein kinase [Candidatus Bathyarchaeota archaeon]
MQTNQIVPLEKLTETKQGQVLCYPRFEQQELEKRIKELESLGVKTLEFTGNKSVFNVPVLGKGCVGIVVIAHTDSQRLALKIRRIDADRKEMFHESEMLQKANSIGIGPKLVGTSANFLLMELIEGTHFPEWAESVKEPKAKIRIQLIAKRVLEKCYQLDQLGLDHGELSNASKHIIVDPKDSPHLIDFETASINRKVSNVTSVCQYLLLGSQTADKLKGKIGPLNKKEIINKLRNYKQNRTKENYEKILQQIN